METVPERLEPSHEHLEVSRLEVVTAPDTAALRGLTARRTRVLGRGRELSAAHADVLWVLSIYVATRGLLLLAAYLQSSFGHHDFLHELSNWDGLWYRQVANHGYPEQVSYGQTTLGFFPLYPLAIWLLKPVLMVLFGEGSIFAASLGGVILSNCGGAVATYFVYRLASGWWGRETARRATVLFVMFPGSVVFSMVYSEGLLLPLAAACLWALERRRWLLAGVLAAFGTAVQPTGLVLIPMCAVAAVLELRRRGWDLSTLRRVIVAPALSLVGVSAFALFLWLWTGTPLANYQAQHHGWHEKTDPLAIVHLASTLGREISFQHFNSPTINLNLVIGLVGAVFLLWTLILVVNDRRLLSSPALVWTAGISFLALTSEFVPPNPRMLITAFPAIMVLARYVRGRGYTLLLWGNGILLVGLSMLTFWGTTLRP